MKSIPEDFIIGAATAAYQAEGATSVGGKGKTYWDNYLKDQNKFDPNTSCDFYHKYPKDLKLAKDFGIKAIRISITWSRILPNGTGDISQEGIDFYHKLIDECISNDIEPFVTLHHFDTPEVLYNNGDWLDSQNINHFVNFANICFKEYGHKVKKWITINEPWSVVAGQYIIGHFPPNIKYDINKAVLAMHNMMLAHSKVVNLYKSMNLKGEIGIVHILEYKYPISNTEEDKNAAILEHTLCNAFLLDATINGYYSKEIINNINIILDNNSNITFDNYEDMEAMKLAASNIDFIGVNYYASHFLKFYNGESYIFHNGAGKKGSSIYAIKNIGQRVVNSEVKTTDWDWPIYPKGLLDMLLLIKNNYPNYKKIYITENGMGYKDEFKDGKIDDTPRIDYMKEHIEATLEAINMGVNIKGYFMWSLMDMFSWTNGYNKRYGLFYVDFNTLERYPKKSAYWIKEISSTKKI